MIKRILTYNDINDKEILSSQSQTIEEGEYVLDIIQDLKDTLTAAEGKKGVGLSAVQIGILKRICLLRYEGKEYIMVNPKIIWKRNGPHSEKTFKEGCLSVPGVYANISRAQKIICEYTNEKGELKRLDQGGWLSAIIQHEIDHMDGISKLYEIVSHFKKEG